MENNPQTGGAAFALPGWPKKIGGVAVDNPIWLAPLAGITFSSFRRFHRALGAGQVGRASGRASGLAGVGLKVVEVP